MAGVCALLTESPGFRASGPPAQGWLDRKGGPGFHFEGASGASKTSTLHGKGKLVTGILEYLLANPLILVPVLLLAAVLVFALLKRLLKLAAVLVIAGVLYVLLVEYVGGGF